MLDQDQTSLSPSKQVCDKILINYAQDAIKTIKNLHQQCNIKSIYSYLRENKPNDEKIIHLTEKELVRQLNLGVGDGILSRKSVSDWQQQQQQLISPTKMSTYLLPESITNSDKLKPILVLLIQTISKLNNQNFTKSIETKSDTNSYTISSICKYLIETYKFKIVDNSNNSISSDAFDSNNRINSHLKECIQYLLKNNEKIFLKTKLESSSSSSSNTNEDMFAYKLDSEYIQKKLEENNKQKISISKSYENDSVLGKYLDENYIFKNLNFKTPFNPEQIIQIESIKRPASLDLDINESKTKANQTCSFCEKPEKSNPLGRFDEFLTCVDCASSAHPYCLKYSSDLIDFIKTNRLKWQCYECKLCSVCLKTSENIVLCDKCDRGYHKECCQPALSKKPKGQFICHVCKQIYLKQIESNTEKQNLNKIIKKQKQTLKSNDKIKLINEKPISKLIKKKKTMKSIKTKAKLKQIPTSLGLIDGMSKFFTPNSTQRHHQFNYYVSTNNTSVNLTNNNNNNQLLARKILKRTKNQRSKQSSNSNKDNSNQSKSLLSNSDKENQTNNNNNNKTNLLYKIKLNRNKYKQDQIKLKKTKQKGQSKSIGTRTSSRNNSYNGKLFQNLYNKTI